MKWERERERVEFGGYMGADIFIYFYFKIFNKKIKITIDIVKNYKITYFFIHGLNVSQMGSQVNMRYDTKFFVS